MTNQSQPLSSCHKAPVRISGRVTMHYECTQCEKPCDLAPIDDYSDSDNQSVKDDRFSHSAAAAEGLLIALLTKYMYQLYPNDGEYAQSRVVEIMGFHDRQLAATLRTKEDYAETAMVRPEDTYIRH